MSDLILGNVEKITEKKTARGTFFSIKVNGDWYGFGKYPPKFGEGSEIEFEVQYNGDFANVDTKSVEVLDLVEAQQQDRGGRGGNRGQRGGSRNPRGGRGDSQQAPQKAPANDKPAADWDLKDEKIQWQAARNSAIALADLAIKAEALKLPAKQADKLDALEAYVSEKTKQFFEDVKTTVWVEKKED